MTRFDMRRLTVLRKMLNLENGMFKPIRECERLHWNDRMPSPTESLLIGKTLKSNTRAMDCYAFLQVASCYFGFNQLAYPEIVGEPYSFDGNGGVLTTSDVAEALGGHIVRSNSMKYKWLN